MQMNKTEIDIIKRDSNINTCLVLSISIPRLWDLPLPRSGQLLLTYCVLVPKRICHHNSIVLSFTQAENKLLLANAPHTHDKFYE